MDGRDPRLTTLVIALAMLVGAPAATAGTRGDGRIEVSIKTVDEEAVKGTLRSLSLRDGAVVQPEGAEERAIPIADIVRITTGTRVSPLTRSGFTLTLTNGDVLAGDILTSPSDAVVMDTLDLGRVSIPLDAVTRIEAAPATQSAHRQAVEWLNRSSAPDEDRVLLTNGDILRGFITAVGTDGIAIDASVGATVVPPRSIVAARLAAPPARPIKAPYVMASLRSTGRITLTDLRWSGATVEARAASDQPLQIEAERIVRLDVAGGRWEWLTGHEPVSVEHTPTLALGFDSAADRNVLGGPIAVAGERYDRGMGVHSQSRLIYDLNGSYRRFVTSLGIDDDSGPFADVTVSILVDGHRRFDLDHVRRGRLHGPVSLDLAGADRLELIVGFGENGDIQDRFDWVEPALIR